MPVKAILSALLLLAGTAWAGEGNYFKVQVIDQETGRGVPLVELETVNHILYVTDSAGLAAVDEPGLMGQPTYFYVRSHGYEYPKDRWGYRGTTLKVEPGGSATVKIKRLNVAERLYRVTGQGVYRDSLLLGEKAPLKNPVLNGGVLGQDSVINAVYKGKLYWFWGDTNRAAHPLGHYETSGAVSDLPGAGGLDPSVGVDLEYFVNKEGFSRPMCPIEGPGPVWVYAMMVVPDSSGGNEPTFLCHYSRMESLAKRVEQGIAKWNDEKKVFEKLVQWPNETTLAPVWHPILVNEGGEAWFYFANPYPVVRVRAKVEEIIDPAKYEAYTCYVPGSTRANAKQELDAAGNPVWGWKANTATPKMPRHLFDSPSPEGTGAQGLYHLTDVETGKPVRAHGGSVYWNEYRKKWVMIALETMGKSMLGEVWYAEGDTLLGPWVYARRIVTHDNYTFYNVKQHPYFDQEGGRRIYFEGTYTDTFTNAPRKTPRYDYNQIMYRLDLDDPRLTLPAPVYENKTEGGVSYDSGPQPGALVRFYAPRRAAGPASIAIPLHSTPTPTFYAMPVEAAAGEAANPALVPLYEYRHGDGRVVYATEQMSPGEGWTRAEKAICRVWRSPRIDPARELGAVVVR